MKRAFSLSALLLMLSVSAFAQITPVPSLMNFQGRLTKRDGTPLADGFYTVTFRIYDAQTGGSKRWEEQVGSVYSRNGIFAVLLGNITLLTDSVFNGTVWLEVQVNGDAPLFPRQRINTVAYAFKANTVPDGAITTAKIGDGAVTTNKIGDGAITAAKIATGSIDNSKLVSDPLSMAKVSGGLITASGAVVVNPVQYNGGGLYALNVDCTGYSSGRAARFAGFVDIYGGLAVAGPPAGYQTYGYAADFRGNVTVSGTFSNPSDARYKTNIATFSDNALDKVLALRGVTYDYKRDDFKAMNFPKGKQVGFIAQELETVLPELVHTDRDGYKSVDYIHVVPVLVEAVKAQQKQIDALKRQNAEIAELKKQLAAIVRQQAKTGKQTTRVAHAKP